MSKKKPEAEETTFEEALQALEQIVGKLEGGKLGLDESLAQYEQGVRCAKLCYQHLRQAERRIELVTSVGPAGEVSTERLEADSEESLAAKGEARSRRRSAPDKRASSGDVDDETSLF
jgi:exodeoxyribonuclease VII small subunit